MTKFTKGQWPDNICSGYITYSEARNYSGYALKDASHGIPTFGAVTENGVRVFNYPGQTEAIAKRLVLCWNACVGLSNEQLEKAMLEEEILPDDYPVNANFLYVADGKVIRSDLHDVTVATLKKHLGAKEIRCCDIIGRQERGLL